LAERHAKYDRPGFAQSWIELLPEKLRIIPQMRHFGKKLFRFVKAAAKVGLALLVIGVVYEMYAAHRDRARFPPPGTFATVDGHKLYLDCTGRGAPTVLLESGLGGPSIMWGRVQPKLAESVRVCSYDRDGIGRSEESGQPRAAQRFAKDLHSVLSSAGEAGPYVLVGHSLGGMLALNFARLYPNDVAGMVLIEPTHPAQFAEGAEQWHDHQQALPIFRAGPYLAVLGWLRGALWATDKLKPLPLPAITRAEYIALASSYKASNAMKAEAVALFGLCRDSAQLPNLQDKPLLVLSGSKSLDEGFPVALREQMARLSTRGIHRIVVNASHSGIVLKPEPAAEVVAGILEVVNNVRSSRPN
jgi:pimeloyl-ACP methyl ester carboxylesterase